MLIRNGAYFNCIAGHNHSGVTSITNFINPRTMRGWFTQSQNDGVQDQVIRDSFPTGTNTPYSYVMGDKGGLLSTTTTIEGDSTLTGYAVQGINIEASIEGLGELSTANLSLIVSLAASLTSVGNISAAGLVGTVGLAAGLTGTGNLTAGLNLITSMSSILAGTGGLSANLKGTLSLEADIYVNQSEATVQQIVEGVWNALTATYNNPGTMGEAMSAAGSAGDPWITNLPGAYGSGSAGYILGNLLANIPDSVWDELKAGHTTTNSYGKIVQDIEKIAKQIKLLTLAQ